MRQVGQKARKDCGAKLKRGLDARIVVLRGGEHIHGIEAQRQDLTRGRLLVGQLEYHVGKIGGKKQLFGVVANTGKGLGHGRIFDPFEAVFLIKLTI